MHNKPFKNNWLDHFKLSYVPEILFLILYECLGEILEDHDYEQNKNLKVKIDIWLILKFGLFKHIINVINFICSV